MNDRLIFTLGLVFGYFIMYLVYVLFSSIEEILKNHRQNKFLMWLREHGSEKAYYELENLKTDYLIWRDRR